MRCVSDMSRIISGQAMYCTYIGCSPCDVHPIYLSIFSFLIAVAQMGMGVKMLPHLCGTGFSERQNPQGEISRS